jgi:hypothetical protein
MDRLTVRTISRVARFFLVKIPKCRKCTKWQQNLPNGNKLCIPDCRKRIQLAIKCTKLIRSKVLIKIFKLGFLAWKHTIWQPWQSVESFSDANFLSPITWLLYTHTRGSLMYSESNYQVSVGRSSFGENSFELNGTVGGPRVFGRISVCQNP